LHDSTFPGGELPTIEEILRRLLEIIPPTLDPQGWIRREIAARTIFVMFYGDAIEGEDRWIRPTAVTDMTDEQAARQASAERRTWLDLAQSPKRPKDVPGRSSSSSSV